MPVRGGGGGGSSVVGINATLTPVSETVTQPASGGLISGGMLDGWRMFDPNGGVDSLADDGSYFDIGYNVGSASAQWMTDKTALDKQPFFCWPNKLMGDFSISVEYVGNRGAGVAANTTNIGVFAITTPTDTSLNTHYGIAAWTWWGSHAAAKWGANTFGTQKVGTDGGVLHWSYTNKLELDRAEGVVSSYYTSGLTAVRSAGVSPGSDQWGTAGDATYVGIGIYTGQAAGSEETMSLVSVTLTGSEWTATP